MKRSWLCERPRLSKHTAQSRGCSLRHEPSRVVPSGHGPFPSFHLSLSVCHIYHCCRLLVRPQLIIQAQISTTYAAILCFSQPLTSKLSNTARLCGSALGRRNPNCPSLLQTQRQRLLAVATHPPTHSAPHRRDFPTLWVCVTLNCVQECPRTMIVHSSMAACVWPYPADHWNYTSASFGR